jgi:hypothetical protein
MVSTMAARSRTHCASSCAAASRAAAAMENTSSSKVFMVSNRSTILREVMLKQVLWSGLTIRKNF